ncbi:chemotaxis protein MotB, partial [Clostridioides difficile]|nr:chemotaxis protein MotB [Clostridioides difficile]
MARKKNKKKDEINPDAWLATYADTITLILTFFVLLYATSVVDMEKFKNIADALKGQFSGTSIFSTGSSTSEKSPIDSVLVDKNDKSNLEQDLKDKVNNSNLQNSVTVKDDSRGILLELDDSILFDSGISELKVDSKATLNKVYDMIKMMKNKIVIEGHT